MPVLLDGVPFTYACAFCQRQYIRNQRRTGTRFCSNLCRNASKRAASRDKMLPPSVRGARWVPLANSSSFALVDTADYMMAMAHAWHVRRSKDGHPYAVAKIDGCNVSMHRWLLGMPAVSIDHVDRDGLNNRRRNLRLAGPAMNRGNSIVQRRNTSGYKGVSFSKRRRCWRADIGVYYRKISLGTFASAEDAARAYDVAARKYFGDYARLNYPSSSERSARIISTPSRSRSSRSTEST